MHRRALLKSVVATAAFQSSVFGASLQSAASARTAKPLPFDPTKLKGLSEKLLRSHYDNNYAGAVRRLGQIESQISQLSKDAPGFQVKGLRMEELIATNSVILHEEYFGNLGGDGKSAGSIQEAIVRDFGSFDKWEQEFRAISAALGGGSGWAILSFSFRDLRLRNYIAFDHTDNVAFGRPVLVNDMFEHAYHMDYGSAAAQYIDAFMQNVKWESCAARLEQARKMAALLQ
jgi:Fe-Mn family superoxide dismutase